MRHEVFQDLHEDVALLAPMYEETGRSTGPAAATLRARLVHDIYFRAVNVALNSYPANRHVLHAVAKRELLAIWRATPRWLKPSPGVWYLAMDDGLQNGFRVRDDADRHARFVRRPHRLPPRTPYLPLTEIVDGHS